MPPGTGPERGFRPEECRHVEPPRHSMRTFPPIPFPSVLLPLLLVGTAFVDPAAGSAAQIEPGDSTALVREARDAQVGFERFREGRIPVTTTTARSSCDERIGRICIWFGGEGEANFPPEPIETSIARRDLVATLTETAAQLRDPWVVGQLVHYLAEDGSLREAEQVARNCDLEAPWWCRALLGYVLHLQEEYVEAEAAFREAFALLPPEEEARWRTPRYLFERDARTRHERLTPEEQERDWELFWRLSDPLFLVEGNDRMTEHYARLVEAMNLERAENTYGMEWGEDMEESLVRYGRTTGWSRVRAPASGLGAGGFQLQDNRQVVGHHHPRSRGYLFPQIFLESPAEIPPESWITAPREARSWYAPPYAPDFRALETQVARFRRGEELLVVGAFRPAPAARDAFAALGPDPAVDARPDLFGGGRAVVREAAPEPAGPEPGMPGGPVRTGLFLIPEGGGEAITIQGDDPAGVLTLTAPTGRYVSSLEVFEPGERRAWRARQGVGQSPLVRGLVGVSDLLILNEDAPFPEDLEAAIPHARPGVRVGADERFTVVWEVYGLGVEEEVQVTLGFTRGRPGFLQRVGEFLGVVEPDQPVEVSFADAGADGVETLFRAVTLGLPELQPGEYTLHLRLDLSGREPAIASRPIVVGP